MAKEFFLPVPLYLQVDCYKDKNEKCGAACTQMVLHDIDLNRPYTAGEQDVLFDKITNPASGGDAWHNPPQGIKKILNEQRPATRPPQRSTLQPDIQAIFTSLPAAPTIPYEFVILGDSSADDTNPNPGILRKIDVNAQIGQIEDLSRQLIRTVALRGAAPVVAVREDNAHWIVVNGFQVEDDYSDADPYQYGKIKAIIIRNPLGRYNYSTVTCGGLSDKEMQVIIGHTCELNPNQPDIVPYATWVREYMYSDWSETFVIVSDRSPQIIDESLPQTSSVASKPLEESEIFTGCNWLARLFPAFFHTLKEDQISPTEAIELAKRAIVEFNLTRLNPRVTPQNALPPYKVKRSDRIDGDYYLVPVGVENKISALINISFTGDFDGASVWPLNIPQEDNGTTGKSAEPNNAEIKPDTDTSRFYQSGAEPNDHYIAPFDQHPQFRALTAGRESILSGRKIRLTDGGPLLTIISVVRDQTTPFVWRPGPISFSASRPFNNLKITVQERSTPISLYVPVDDYCLPGDGSGNILLPSANYLEMVADCIKQSAGSMVDEVLALVSRSGSTAMVMYKSNQTTSIKDETEEMSGIICKCLQDNPYPGLEFFRFKAYATDEFLTRQRGGGDDGPIISEPESGGGGDGIQIGTCA
ncbi:MAG TPA: hypothetical protein VE961_08980 [Pyrinomonadaceae bacterium]|nr:hypothetical protein [Pyrinomonadaceae bacterium]